jgi:hypothetical protein
MNQLQKLNKKLILCIVAGLLVLQWVGVTHSHDSDIDVDRICSICLVKKNISHGVVSSKLIVNLNAAIADLAKPFTIQRSKVYISYYHSRAPPVYL